MVTTDALKAEIQYLRDMMLLPVQQPLCPQSYMLTEDQTKLTKMIGLVQLSPVQYSLGVEANLIIDRAQIMGFCLIFIS